MSGVRRTIAIRALVPIVVLAGFGPASMSAGGPCAGVARAEGTNRAGVVVQFSDLSVREYCVSFTEASITGLELLRRTALTIVYEDAGGGSVVVCKIAGEGCSYPRQRCFCKCADPGGACTFWGYYSLSPDTGLWTFSGEGAGSRRIRDGDVDGWRWGNHGTQGLTPPPPNNLEQICSRGTKVAARRARGATPAESGDGRPVAVSTRGSQRPSSANASASTDLRVASPSASRDGDDATRSPLDGEAAGARERSRGPGTPAAGILAFVVLLVALGLWGWRLSKNDDVTGDES